MLDKTTTEAEAAVRAAAEEYCRALHAADTSALGRIFHEDSHLYLAQEGVLTNWPRRHFLDRVRSRQPGQGAPDFEIESVDVAGPEMAVVRLSVGVPPRRYRDYLNFLKIGGEWRVISKVFRVADGPAV
jgi:hypothetical protein